MPEDHYYSAISNYRNCEKINLCDYIRVSTSVNFFFFSEKCVNINPHAKFLVTVY